jgi:hypothetical protein
MYVAYKNNDVTGYTAIITNGQTQGGGWLKGPEGGGFRADPCGQNPCSWDAGKQPHDWRQTNVVNATSSLGFCESSAFHDCFVEGHCQNATGTGVGAKMQAAIYSDKTTSSLFKQITCVDGLTSTQTESENPYTKTAEQACTTSENSGKDISFAGKFPTTTKACEFMTPSGAVSLYAGGNFPLKPDGNYDVTQTYYDNCGKADTFKSAFPKYEKADPCPIYFEPDCENAIILSKPGSYITASSKNVGPFSTITVHPLSMDKAVEFNIVSGKESPKNGDTFSYSNSEVTLSGLKAKESTYTNSYIWIDESGASTSTYEVGAGGYAGGDAVTLFESGEVKATRTEQVTDCRGKGCDPCCTGEDCTTAESTYKGTETLFAGSSFAFTHCKISTIKLGQYFAYQPTTISRGDHLAWGEFAFSTTIGNRWNGQERKEEGFECVSMKKAGVVTCYECCTPKYQNTHFMAETTKETKDKVTCDLGCACANNTTKVSTIPAYETEPTQCQTQINTAECYWSEDFCWGPPGSVYSGGIEYDPQNDPDDNPVTYPICCIVNCDSFDPDTVKSSITRTGTCSITYKYSYQAEYTHYTSAQTLTTEMNGGFQATLQKSEGLYYLDSKGSMQTATSFSLKQSKSDITNSHVSFAFSGVYYNPIGRTTQFGSDGAKKTFIALATGDAVYLVGSPDGKSKGTATASHDGDVHSYYISDPDAKSAWNQASWPGHGVVNGKITTGTFSFSFMTGAFANSYGENGTLARFLPGAKQTIVANGGLNVISSKGNASEKSFKTTYSTAAFSTSFDSTFKGAWIAKAVPYTFVSTKSVNWWPWRGVADDASSHIFPINCAGCDFPQPAIPYPLIPDTASYFVKGEKSLLYNNNANSYLWTHPAFKKLWGAGHGGDCEE